jgi:replicative DNA helicase
LGFGSPATNPSYFDAARGKLNDEQWGHLDSARDDIERWPLSIDVRPGLTVANMLAASRRKIREWERAGIEPGVIIVDHLTIARVEKERQGNKVAEVGDISRGLAEMAKTLDLPVVALCQLSRDVEKRDKVWRDRTGRPRGDVPLPAGVLRPQTGGHPRRLRQGRI